MIFTCGHQDDLEHICKKILDAYNQKIIILKGELGAGKTTLVKVFCSVLGVKERVSSPSFSIIQEYRTDKKIPIYHFDFYRIKDFSEILNLGLDEYLESGNYCFIEWPEIIMQWFSDSFIEINIKLHQKNLDRIIQVDAYG
ncbi:MAG TPA: tRNA (adenosine(37)-N6)-threonylcarbamoyltransferase complex ATPase subunit type 1 TsaE [Cyclobacteriaceae bacterium]